MKAIVHHEYGSADVLKCEDVEKPVPKDDEVLIKIRAASVNPLDWRLMQGTPSVVRLGWQYLPEFCPLIGYRLLLPAEEEMTETYQIPSCK